TYCDPLDGADPEKHPFVLCSGGRLPHAIHTRLHKVDWLRSMQPEPTAQLSVEDAQALGLEAGDDMELYTPRGTIVVKAKPSHRVQKGVVFFYHGYSEADVNSLMDKDHVDPYSGFPAYNATRCGMRKKAQP
ncbi:MAG: formate dehydrogenase, partial [Oscillospiraceae bacterium]|nr:formate dehydrogenase [Oscillospiraceae bacterium]